MKKIILIFFILSLFVSCQSTGFLMAKAKVTMITEAYPSKDENATIEVFYTSVPTEPFIEIAQIRCDDTEEDWCLKQIKIKAREIGADGIIILGKSTSASVGIPMGYMYYVATEAYGIKAIAFKYK